MKTIEKDFDHTLSLLKQGKPFAFNRFSDGELFILQNKLLVLDNQLVQVGEKKYGHSYTKEDFKRFDPVEHSFYQKKLVEAFQFRKKGYYKGITCRCCISEEDYEFQFSLIDKNEDNLTWANLLVNGNYPRFIQEMLPLFNEYPVVFICNEHADLCALPSVVKDFRVGYNAMVNDYHKIEEMKNWILKNNIKNHLFLFSASSFSKLAIHQLYEVCDQNTYIDVGTTLNIFMDMKLDRSYLKEFWLKEAGSDLSRMCIW